MQNSDIADKILDELNILYEDNHVIVVLKPQNIPVQEDKSSDLDLLNIIKRYRVKNENKAGDAYVGLLHRLDRPTGGIIAFAKTSKAASRLSESIKDGEFSKKYLAVTVGVPLKNQGVLEHYLLKDGQTNNVLIVPSSTTGAKRAQLDYKVLETKTTDAKNSLSLIEVNLITGRSHQIRVQLNSLGTYVFGDLRYGKKESFEKGANLALWASELKFIHPVTKDIMTFKAFPPEDQTPWKYFDIEKHLIIK
jgi:23S rRNA pseudouridine1911/1915/1917 synthase